MNPFQELEKLLDQYKRCSQLAGIAQQRASEHLAGAKDDTVAWLDKAEEKRAKILEWVQEYANRFTPTAKLNDPTATATQFNVLIP